MFILMVKIFILDYGHWVVGLIRIGTADIGDKYISGEMIYRRSNGIYANGSVRFNLIKKYQTTNMFAGVLYVGYGLNTGPRCSKIMHIYISRC